MPAVFDAFDGAPVTRAALQASEVKVVSTNPSESGPTVRVRAAGRRLGERVERHTSFPLQDVTGTYSLSIAGPAGGIVTNSEDLATFWRALFDGELVSRKTLGQMERTVPTGENSKGVRVTWGLGFGRQQIAPGVLWKGSPRFDVWMHLGDIFGWESAAYYVPQEDLVVTNTDNLFPTPVGDLGLLRDVLRLYSSS
jgi:CubicO group peptidase (beta-lactamase class C family)